MTTVARLAINKDRGQHGDASLQVVRAIEGQDRNKAIRIVNLINDVQRDPFKGIGKPEPLKHEFKGCWSR